MKLYRNLVSAVATTLQDVFIGNYYADKSIERLFKKNTQWGSRDRRFVAEAVYDIVRNYRLYATLAGSDRNFWFMVAVWLWTKGIAIPAWQEFRDFDAALAQRTFDRVTRDPRVALSFPDWLWELCTKELGEDSWRNIATSLHQQAPVFIRANTLKTDANSLCDKLVADGIACSPTGGSAIRLEGRVNVFRHPLFAEGWFEVQDAGSQQIAGFLDPKAGETVIDACAGAGGKSLHIAALMRNKGRIVSMDVDHRKLETLKIRARRAGCHNIETRHISGDAVIASLHSTADRVLLDVPCTGLGVLKRNPDTKWKLSPESVQSTLTLQQRILSEYAYMVRPGGSLVYSTCSILPSENRSQVNAFISNHSGFKLESDLTIDPSGDTDGFYMARMRRETANNR